MTAHPFTPAHLRQIAETAVIATAGGALFDYLGFPAGWMAGAMLFSAFAALCGRVITVPTLPARIFFIALGITIGGVATPETVQGMATWPASIALLSVGMVIMTVATGVYLIRVHGWESQTALFAAVPGALSQVVILALERDADLRGIVIVQTVRTIVLVVGVPATLVVLGLGGPTRLPTSALAFQEAPIQFTVLVGGCILSAIALYRIGFSGGFFFGPMVVSAVLHGTGYVATGLPVWLVAASMIGLGAVNGSRFSDTTFRMLASYLGASLGALAVVIAVAAVFVAAGWTFLSLSPSNLIASYAPGAVDAMMILALALHLDPVFVGAHHLARIIVVSTILPIGARLTAPDMPPHPHPPLPEPLETARETLED
jgi:uncharacterized protein